MAARDEDGREIGAFRNHRAQRDLAGGPVEAVEVAQITAVGFNITRVTPVIGRAIVAADESAGASPIVVIGYDVWHSRFGGDASVLGRELRLGNVVHTIVGVMPAVRISRQPQLLDTTQ